MSINLMVNGLPGNMAKEVISAALRRGWNVLPFSLTGKGSPESFEHEGRSFKLLGPEDKENALVDLRKEYGNFISVDYTHPSAVNVNGSFYSKNQLPFVMGTTGGDRELLFKEVVDSKTYAVIAPNMCKPIVVLQSMIAQMAQRFPGVFEGYTLRVAESHQKTKADTSGTAKAIVASLNDLGMPFGEEDIVLHREEQAQLDFGVPADYLNGHAYHTYEIISPDGTAEIEFQHNINGRRIYAEGTCDAALFLASRIAMGAEQKLYNMIEVLEAGAMKS